TDRQGAPGWWTSGGWASWRAPQVRVRIVRAARAAGGGVTGTLPTGVQAREGERLLALVRHGRTAWNAERRFLGKSDIPLDEEGEAEVARLAAACAGRFAQVVSSPLARARQTAATLAPSVAIHAGLSELDQGALE